MTTDDKTATRDKNGPARNQPERDNDRKRVEGEETGGQAPIDPADAEFIESSK